MTDLPIAHTNDAVEQLLTLEDDEALEVALESASPASAALAVALAGSLERKTTLLWAMEDRQRRQVLELTHPAVIAALVQNLEDDNRYLLGDLSIEHFRRILGLCSPERQYYWLTTSLSFTDARANALPLLISTGQLVESLLTNPEFEQHLRILADYPIEDQRLPGELMTDPAQTLIDLFGAENLLTVFPIQDARLAAVLQMLLDLDQDRYVDLLREGFKRLDYQQNRPLEWEQLVESPILLSTLDLTPGTLEVLPDEPETGEPVQPVSLVPFGASSLVRVLTSLAPEDRLRVGVDLQYLSLRQAVAEGGSFRTDDLARVARSVQAYLVLGLQSLSEGDPAREAAMLAHGRVDRLHRRGAQMVEALRQVALRLQPLTAILDGPRRAFVRSLVHPRLTLSAEGAPRIAVLPGAHVAELLSLEEAAAALRQLAAWADLARAIGMSRTSQALTRLSTVDAVLMELAVSTLAYGRFEYGLPTGVDRAALRNRYAEGQLPASALERLDETLRQTMKQAVPASVRELLLEAVAGLLRAEETS